MMRADGSFTNRGMATAAVLTALVLGLWFNQSRGLKKVATDTHSALCTFRADIQNRHDATVKYLLDHPRGLTTKKGDVVITAAQFKQSLKTQESTLNALRRLGDC